MSAMLRLPAISLVAITLSLAGGAAACSPDGTPEPTKFARTAPSAPTPLTLAADRTDLVFRYLDPQSGTVATAGALADVPAAARRQVVIYDPKAPAPAGWEQVADLSNGLPATTTPKQDFAFPVAAATRPVTGGASADTSGNHEVVMFTSAGCGYCAKARKFLKSRSIPFTELDLDADPKAPARLSSLGQRAGLSQGDMQGVPIIFVDGRAVLGWDEATVSKLLGLHG